MSEQAEILDRLRMLDPLPQALALLMLDAFAAKRTALAHKFGWLLQKVGTPGLPQRDDLDWHLLERLRTATSDYERKLWFAALWQAIEAEDAVVMDGLCDLAQVRVAH